MRELAGRLSALDPEATESLKVIEYFDQLVDGRVGSDGMLRGAAVLSGAPVGYRPSARLAGARFDSAGVALADGTAEGWPSTPLSDGGEVWLERSGRAHANDAMILERLAISLSIQSHRLDSTAPTRRAVEMLVSGGATETELDDAMSRLALPARVPVHAIAIPPALSLAEATSVPHAIVATRFGVVRAVLSPASEPQAVRAGIGVAAHSAVAVRDSWRSALIALRLSDAAAPVVAASALGPLLELAELGDQREQPHGDVLAVDRALDSGWSLSQLVDIAAGVSTRSLASSAGVHHSTMDARRRKLPSVLGFDPADRGGATRFEVALMLHRLAHARIE